MDYKSYQNVRDVVWRLLIDQAIDELPISVTDLCHNLGVVVKLYTPEDDNDGKSTMIGGTPYIFVSKNCSVQRQRFTAAHELGHILLGHTGKYKLVNREPSPNDNPIEAEANIFASRLLAPACVLWGCNVTTAEQIQELCQISKQAAEYRMERMNELHKRNKFLSSPLERQVYKQFNRYIKNHQHPVNF